MSDPEALALRNGIESAVVPRAAFHEAAGRERQTDEKTAGLERLAGVVRTRGSKTASARGREHGQGRRDCALINPDYPAEKLCGKAHKLCSCHSERSEESMSERWFAG